MDMPVREPVHFREVIGQDIFGFEDMLTSLESIYPDFNIKYGEQLEQLLSLLDTTGKVHSTAISYMTKDPNGHEILASGIVLRPLDRASRGMLHFFPSAKIDKTTTGSELMITFEGILSFFGYTVIVPDLIGYGVSSDREYPFLFAGNTGQVAYDMHLATAEYFQSIGLPFPRKVTIGGYSMGSLGVVALHRHIELYGTDGFVVEKSYPGGGVYDLGMAVDILSRRRYTTFSFVPYMYVAMNYWYGLNIDYSQVFIDPLLSNMDDWLSRKYLATEMALLLSPDMTTYMHPDLFTPERNASLNKVDSCLRLHSVIEGWAPRAPMTIIHTVNDNMAPYEIAEKMYNNFLEKGGNVNLIRWNDNHFDSGIVYYLTMILYMLIN
ncbi:MAG: alpha/beta hydrolase [Bacteroidales bacterium]|nr:alpha/beta hydrolase [Bacteroidales bacterium]MDD4434576.1 alpha/beta hydrolase [Bacteroidales bacterium]MDD5733168.1 alpha/beta hydrolase [Bacteroidales bacterium]